MSSRTSPAVLPVPKRPRLLAPGDEAFSTPAVPSAAPNSLARANYTGRDPAPTQAVTTLERDMADGPLVRPAYSPEDYKRLLKMHRCGQSAERIAYVLGRSTSSVINHFRKRKPIWLEAGEQVEPEWLLRDKDIDYDKRIQKELASSSAVSAALIQKAHLAASTRPAATGSPSTCASSLQAGTSNSAEISKDTNTTPLFPPFKFGNHAPPPCATATAQASQKSRPPPVQPVVSPFRSGNNAPAPPNPSATAQSTETSRPSLAEPVVPSFRFGNDASATAPAPPKVEPFAKIGPQISMRVAHPPIQLPTAAQTVATSTPAPSSTGFSAYSTAASFVPTASISSSSPVPSLASKPVPTSAPLPIAVAPSPPVKPVLQVKPAASPNPPPPATPAPTTTTASDILDPDASPLSPLSDDSPPSPSPRVPNPVPHHAAHLPLLPLWCDGHYEQGMSSLKRFLNLVEGSRKSRTSSS